MDVLKTIIRTRIVHHWGHQGYAWIAVWIVIGTGKIGVRLLHLQRCLILTKKKSLRGTISAVGVVAATATSTTINPREGAKQNTRCNHGSYRNTVLLSSCRDSSSWTKRTRRRRRRSRHNGQQRRCFIDIIVVVCLVLFLVRHD